MDATPPRASSAGVWRGAAGREGPIRSGGDPLISESAKSLLQCALIVLTLCGLFAWLEGKPGEITWTLRLWAPPSLAVVGWLLYRGTRRPPETLPDLLGDASGGSFFEADGLCFVPGLFVENGRCEMRVLFQNRFAGPCTGRVVIKPPRKWFGFGRKLPSLNVPFECPGGAFGVVRVPYAVPESYRGKTMKFDVGATAKYRGGRGEMLRFRRGTRVSASADGSGALSILTLFLGFYYHSTPANFTAVLPADDLPEPARLTAEPVTQILWTPEPTAPAPADGLMKRAA